MRFPLKLSASNVLPTDGSKGTLVGRVWRRDAGGPSVVRIDDGGVTDITQEVTTVSELLETSNPISVVRSASGPRLGDLDEVLPNLLAPCDLQVVKASGVTFAISLLERVIEERAGGDLSKAAGIRAIVESALGGELSDVKPGSETAQRLKAALQAQGMWSQYLEVGIGPDAEIFTKAPILSAVGAGAHVGIHPSSKWNNPEPEVVLAINSRGTIVGATLGNDVNLRDVEGRSALLLGKAKDNNASCAIGPFIRLFDESFSLDDLRKEEVHLLVEGDDGFVLRGVSSMSKISRDPEELVRQAIGVNHQYPDGLMLFLGTMFAPTEDRGEAGRGFTHHVGDVVTVRSDRLGNLTNLVTTSDAAPPWTFGVRALYKSLAERGLLHND